MGRFSTVKPRTKKLDKINKDQLMNEKKDRLRSLKEKKAVPVDASLEITFNSRRSATHVGRKYRAPRAIRDIRLAARKRFQVADVKIDSELNRAVWGQGITNPPKKLRLLMTHRVEESGDKPKNVIHVSYLPVTTFNNLKTRVVEDSTEETA